MFSRMLSGVMRRNDSFSTLKKGEQSTQILPAPRSIDDYSDHEPSYYSQPMGSMVPFTDHDITSVTCLAWEMWPIGSTPDHPALQ